jgi:hypothetical protein
MASGPKLEFGSTEQDVSARGERKWDVQAAVTYHAEPGLKPVSEVIAVRVTGPELTARWLGQEFANDFHSSSRRLMSATRPAALPSSTAASPGSARR